LPNAIRLILDYNQRAQHVHSLTADVTIEATRRDQGVSFPGQLAVRYPQDLRLVGKWLGQPGIDLGSNDRVFWLRLETGPELSVPRGGWQRTQAGWPVSDAPDALLHFLCMSPLPLAANLYEVRRNTHGAVELMLPPFTDVRGALVRRGIAFDKQPAGMYRPAGETLYDGYNENVLRRATFRDFRQDAETGADVPTQITVEWPADHVTIVLSLNSLRLNEKWDGQRAAALFRLAEKPEPSPDRLQPGDAPTVRVSTEAVEARFGTERLGLSGKTDGETARKVLVDQLSDWREKTATLTVVCTGDVTAERVRLVLAAARQAGFRSIDVRVEDGRPGP
jgi:hypothetical protein